MTVIRRPLAHLPLEYYHTLPPAERKYAVQITDAILADLTHTRVARTPEIRRALRQARWARLRLKLLPYTAAAAQRYARAVAQAAQSIVNQPHR